MDEIRTGRATVADCLNKYPQHAEQLAPLLELGSALLQLADVKPAPAFQQATRARLLDLPRRPMPSRHPRFAFPGLALPPFKVAAVALVLLILVIGMSGGAVAASSESLPGSWLYPVKRASEQVQLFLETDPVNLANVHMQIANHRLSEAVALSQAGQEQLAQETLSEYGIELSRTVEIISAPSNDQSKSLDRVTQGLIKQQEQLREIKNPHAAQEILRHALSISEQALEKIAPEETTTPTLPAAITAPVSPTLTIQPSAAVTPTVAITESPKEKPTALETKAPPATPPAKPTAEESDKTHDPPPKPTDAEPDGAPKDPHGKGPPPDKGKPTDGPKATDEPKGKPTPKAK
ncbi:MAG: hypothetical protein HZB51_19870 [Chloroflexi bacterium]|nr:hypothetical protein [Chloroflexota bacterium]